MLSKRQILRIVVGGICLFPLFSLLAQQNESCPAPQFTINDLTDDAISRRAMEGAIWGMPIVSFDAMRQAYFRDAKAKYNDIVYWSNPGDAKLQITTPNASSRYVYANFNTKEGPVVLEVPAALGAGLFGSLEDAWQVPLVDIGPQGEDKGKGGKYLILPPDYKENIPAGFIPVHSKTLNGYLLFRAIPEGTKTEDVDSAIALIKKIKLYPLSQSKKIPEQKYINMSGKMFDAIVHLDSSFFNSLSRMINEEPIQARDMVMMGQLNTLGIGKDQVFNPDEKTKVLLQNAAEKVLAWFMERTVQEGMPYWPNRKWHSVSPIGAKTAFTFQTDKMLDLDERGIAFFLACAAPAKLGKATYYLTGYFDSEGNEFSGENNYKTRIPAKVPAKQFWAVTVYDRESAGFIRKSPQVELNSYHQDMKKNSDGSVFLYFGPKAPPGFEANWIYTEPGKKWFTFFRFYGPEQTVFDKTFVLEDIQKITENN